MILTLPTPVAGPSHAFVRAHACRRVASCRAGSAMSIGSTHAAARTRSHPSGGRRCGFRASMLLPHPRRDWAYSCHTMAEPGTALPHPIFGVARGRCARAMHRRCRRTPSSRRRSRTSSRSSSRKSTACGSALYRLSGHICAGSTDLRGRFCRGSALRCGRYKAFMQASLVQHDLRTSSLEELVRPTQSRRRCGRGGPSPGADVGGVGPVPMQMWQGWAQSWCRCGRGEPSPGADVGGVGPVLMQMWQGWAQSWCRCGRGGPSPGADVGGVSPVPVHDVGWDPKRARALLRCRGARGCRLCRTPSACAGVRRNRRQGLSR
jgi:hypothetical protein